MADPRRRQLGLVAVLAVAGAAIAAVSAALTWWSAEYVDPLTGPLTVEVTGAEALPELIPVALVGLAGFGAALATRGWPRRLVGVVIAGCGLLVLVRSAMLFGAAPSQLVTDLVRPADPVGEEQLHALGPLLGVFGGLLLAASGLAIVVGMGARRLGSRYDAPSRPSMTGGGSAAAAVPTDPADWWKALDAGADPTDRPDGDPTVSDDTPGGGYHDPNASRQT